MNGFDPEWVEAERVCVIPESVEEAYFSAEDDRDPWPGYVFGREFFEGIGAEFRTINDTLQMLIDEVVYEVEDFAPCFIQRAYAIGGRSVTSFDIVPEFLEINSSYVDRDHFGSVSSFVYEAVGRCLFRCQEIEENLASSFIFGVPQKNKSAEKTLNDLRSEWKKLTFGQLVSLIKRDWDMLPEVSAALDIFRDHRNLFVHGVSTHPRYDLSTRWGVLEFFPFLQFFDLQTKILVRASEYSVAASISVALESFELLQKPELDLPSDHDEKAAVFFELFWFKGQPWPRPSMDDAVSEDGGQ